MRGCILGTVNRKNIEGFQRAHYSNMVNKKNAVQIDSVRLPGSLNKINLNINEDPM